MIFNNNTERARKKIQEAQDTLRELQTQGLLISLRPIERGLLLNAMSKLAKVQTEIWERNVPPTT